MYSVKIDKKKCTNCGLCAQICSDVFEANENETVVKAKKTDKECTKEAAESCPSQAIIVKEV